VLEYGKASDGSPDWNNVEDNGGAILCNYNTIPLLVQSCTIQNCIAISAGAIKVHQGNIILLNNIIKNNKANDAGAISIGYSNGLIASNIITNNTTIIGGIVALDNTNGLIVNNLVVNNNVTNSQGTIYVNSSDISKKFSFFNNLIANNLLQGICAGVYIDYFGSHPRYINNIIWGNEAQGNKVPFYPDTVRNVIYNTVEQGYSGVGNDDSYPWFVNPTAGAGTQYDGLSADWSVKANSPCIDKGKPDFTLDSVGIKTDFADNPRIQHGRIDIGAFESTPALAINEPDRVEIVADGISIFPNPAGESFTVIASSGSVIMLYNQTGTLIESRITTNNLTNFDTSDLPTGVYMIKIDNGHTVSVQKVILNRSF
jgi:hypothetical protein